LRFIERISLIRMAAKNLDRVAKALEEQNRICRVAWSVPSLQELENLGEPEGAGVSWATDEKTKEFEEEDAKKYLS